MTPFSHAEGRRAFNDFYDWMIPPPGFGVYKPDYFALIFDIVLSPDPMLEPPYDPVKDGVELAIGYDIWVCACMLDAAVNGTDYSRECIGYDDRYRQLCQSIQLMLHKKSFWSRKPVYNTAKMCRKAADSLQLITGTICTSEIAEKSFAQQEEFIASIELLRRRLLSAISDNTVCDCK